MPNQLARRSHLLFLLLLAVAALAGGTRPAPAQAALTPDLAAQTSTTLKVQAYLGLAARGFRRDYYFNVQGDGPITLQATLRVKGRLALSGTMKRVNPRWQNRDTWRPKAISKSFPGMTYYSYCITATDAAGHTAKNCARVTVT